MAASSFWPKDCLAIGQLLYPPEAVSASAISKSNSSAIHRLVP